MTLDTFVIQRHLIRDSGSAKEFEAIVERALTAKHHFRNLQQGILVSCREGYKIEADLQRKLAQGKVTLDIRAPRGAGTSLYQGLFDFGTNDGKESPLTYERKVIFVFDADQFHIDSSLLHQGFSYFSDRMQDKAGMLLGLGARSKVVLSHDKEADIYRQIHELVISYIVTSLTNRELMNPLDLDLSRVPRGYRTMGESASGFYALNGNNPQANKLKRAVDRAQETADLSGFAMDYYLSIKAATLEETRVSAYVLVLDNPFSVTSVEEEIRRVKTSIASDTRELAKTDIGTCYHSTLSERRAALEVMLSQHYSRASITSVINLIESNLK